MVTDYTILCYIKELEGRVSSLERQRNDLIRHALPTTGFPFQDIQVIDNRLSVLKTVILELDRMRQGS